MLNRKLGLGLHCHRVLWMLVSLVSMCHAVPCRPVLAIDGWGDAASSRETESDAVRRMPIQKVRRDAQALVREVVENPSFFRRMPTQAIDCDPQLFNFLVRYPEVMVNIWDLMGITKVNVKRTGPFSFNGDDGAGTTCKCDLVLASESVHVYCGTGMYRGSMAPRPITGKCVCVLYSGSTRSVSGGSTVSGVMDIFIKLDSFGADLVTRTLAPLVGKTADYNFAESAKFISQISQVCERSPDAALALADRLQKIEPAVREEFSYHVARIGSESVRQQYLDYAQRTLPGAASRADAGNADRPPAADLAGNDPRSRQPIAMQPSPLGNNQSLGVVEKPNWAPRASSTGAAPSLAAGGSSRNRAANQSVPPSLPKPSQPVLGNVRMQPPVSPAKPNVYMRR